MNSWYQLFPKNPWLSIYAWIIFCILPFFFIFRTSSYIVIIIGIMMIFLFFLSYRFSFMLKGWLVYVWVSIEIIISFGMTVLFGYVYFSLFLAFFIGNIQNKVGFFIIYSIHLTTTLIAVTLGAFLEKEIFFTQFPFILICIIGVILLPFNIYNRNKREKLEGQLEEANKRISQLMVFEERQRIARDLHDTLGQKLTLIGLKSDLAGKLIHRDLDSAEKEINDIQQTARTALKEVRELVIDMRGVKLEDEVIRIRQILKAAQINFTLNGNPKLLNTPLLIKSVLSMCLKEAVTNVVKHSQASTCDIVIKQSPNELLIKVQDNGIGISEKINSLKGHGLQGMKERLEFVNGSLGIESNNGTTLIMRVPNIIKHSSQEE